MNGSAALSDVRTADGTGSSEMADTSGFALVIEICAADTLQRYLLIYFSNFTLKGNFGIFHPGPYFPMICV